MMWGSSAIVALPAPGRDVNPASTPSVTLLAALGNPSKATKRALNAVFVWENSALSLRESAELVDAGLTYTATLARHSPADRGRVARNELTIAQIIAGERLAAIYDAGPVPPPALPTSDSRDATLEQIGPAYVTDWLDRVTAPSQPTVSTVALQPAAIKDDGDEPADWWLELMQQMDRK